MKIFRNIANSLSNKYKLLPSLYGRGLGVGLLFALSLSSCKEENTNHADLAAETAKVYYEQLLNGDIAAFVDGTAMHVDVVPTYREDRKSTRLNSSHGY